MDHYPILFQQPMQLEKFGKPFQFFNFMIDLPDFMLTVASIWSKFIPGDPILVLGKKIKLIKQALRDLNKATGNVNSKVALARALLADTHDKLKSGVTEDLLSLEKK